MTTQEQFEKYHSDNPHVYDKLKKLALEVKATGRKHFAINALHERLRWYFEFETEGDPFKINNNYRPFYARKLMAEVPELADFFEIRSDSH